ncbi:MAG: hypothetical protein Q8R60_05125 [Mycobacteriales bacterium]|nr:hypothetical protein [Mycobacteriales bacterium]
MRVTDDDAAMLERAAAKEGRPASDLLHEAILDYTSGWRRRRDQLLDDILEVDAKLLRKLGTT